MEQYIVIGILAYLIIVNLIGFAIMYIDKGRARKNQWRIQEKTIFLCGLIGGCIGVWLGMQICRHKTKHISFVVGIPAIFIVQIIIFYLLIK